MFIDPEYNGFVLLSCYKQFFIAWSLWVWLLDEFGYFSTDSWRRLGDLAIQLLKMLHAMESHISVLAVSTIDSMHRSVQKSIGQVSYLQNWMYHEIILNDQPYGSTEHMFINSVTIVMFSDLISYPRR